VFLYTEENINSGDVLDARDKKLTVLFCRVTIFNRVVVVDVAKLGIL